MFSYKFAAYFQNSFLQEHLWRAAFVVKIEEKDEFHVIGQIMTQIKELPDLVIRFSSSFVFMYISYLSCNGDIDVFFSVILIQSIGN